MDWVGFQSAMKRLGAYCKVSGDNPAITARLFVGSALLMLGFALMVSIFVFAIAWLVSQERQDDLLEEAASLMARDHIAYYQRPAAFEVLSMDDDDFEDGYLTHGVLPRHQELLIHTLHKSGRATRYIVKAPLSDGLHTLEIDGKTYRVAILLFKNGNYVAVAQRLKTIFEESLFDTVKAIAPLAILFCLLFFFLVRLFWRTMQPVARVSATIEARPPEALEPIDTQGLPQEVLPLVTSMNGLLTRMQELRQAEVRFVADAAHELRSPLAALSLLVERLQKEALTESQREQVRHIDLVVQRASRQVSQLLALKRAQAQSTAKDAAPVEPAPTPISLTSVLARVVESVWAEAESKGIQLSVEGLDTGPEPWVTEAYENDLFTVLRNLVENAVHYSPANQDVSLRVDQTNGLRVDVVDHGRGIALADKKRVFDPFYRVLGTGVSGTGLGLAIVKTLCDRNGWTVALEDTDPKATPPGLAVALTLPCVAASSAKSHEAVKAPRV